MNEIDEIFGAGPLTVPLGETLEAEIAVTGRIGLDGASVTDAGVGPDGTLSLTLSDGRVLNAGRVVGKAGLAGVASPSTRPAVSPDAQLYVASGVGAYAHFRDAAGQPLTIRKENVIAFFFKPGNRSWWERTELEIALTDYARTAQVEAIDARFTRRRTSNLFDPSEIDSGEFYGWDENRVLGNEIVTGQVMRSGYIPVEPGKTYRVFKAGLYRHKQYGYAKNGCFDSDRNPIGLLSVNEGADTLEFTPTEGTGFVVLNLDAAAVNPAYYLAEKENYRYYEPYLETRVTEEAAPERVLRAAEAFGEAVLRMDGLARTVNENRLDPSAVNREEFYDWGVCAVTGNAEVSGQIVRSDYLPVEPGAAYRIRKAGLYRHFSLGYDIQGYFDTDRRCLGLAEVAEAEEYIEIAVPENRCIRFLVLNLQPGFAPEELYMARRERYSVYMPYGREVGVLPETLTREPDRLLPAPVYPGVSRKFPRFTEKFLRRREDVTIVVTGGTAALGAAGCTLREDAPFRPPLLEGNHLASLVFDRLSADWPGQEYRRWDAPGVFTETGVWSTPDATDIESYGWDDRTAGRTAPERLASAAGASVAFSVPAGMRRCNFVYRSDTLGGECTVQVGEGDGRLQAWDGTAWREANGFVFSTLEFPATDTKGNTTFQKRLCFRARDAENADTSASAKTVTIVNGAERKHLCYWGIEYSPREYLFTLVNAAREGHNWSTNPKGLGRYQDNDIWGFAPDLLLAEITTAGWEGDRLGSGYLPQYFADSLASWYFNVWENNGASIPVHGADTPGWEMILFQPPFGLYAENHDASGDPATAVRSNGDIVTVRDNYDAVAARMLSEYAAYAFADISRFAAEALGKRYGNLRDGLTGSGPEGATLTADGVHPNDTGHRFMARYVLPFFDFL